MEDLLFHLAFRAQVNPGLADHGWPHIISVRNYATLIAFHSFPDIQQDCRVAGYMHDAGREDDSSYGDHAARGAEIFERWHAECKDRFPPMDWRSISFAIRYHSWRKAPGGDLPIISNFPIPEGIDWRIAACLWDADRLDLARLGRRIDPVYLSLDFSKRLANSETHLRAYRRR